MAALEAAIQSHTFNLAPFALDGRVTPGHGVVGRLMSGCPAAIKLSLGKKKHVLLNPV